MAKLNQKINLKLCCLGALALSALATPSYVYSNPSSTAVKAAKSEATPDMAGDTKDLQDQMAKIKPLLDAYDKWSLLTNAGAKPGLDDLSTFLNSLPSGNSLTGDLPKDIGALQSTLNDKSSTVGSDLSAVTGESDDITNAKNARSKASVMSAEIDAIKDKTLPTIPAMTLQVVDTAMKDATKSMESDLTQPSDPGTADLRISAGKIKEAAQYLADAAGVLTNAKAAAPIYQKVKNIKTLMVSAIFKQDGMTGFTDGGAYGTAETALKAKADTVVVLDKNAAHTATVFETKVTGDLKDADDTSQAKFPKTLDDQIALYDEVTTWRGFASSLGALVEAQKGLDDALTALTKTEDDAAKTDLKKANSLGAAAAAANSLMDKLSSLDDDAKAEIIELYYFPSVPEAMKALSLDAHQYTDPFFSTADTETAIHGTLLDAENKIALDNQSLNTLLQNRADLEAQLQSAKDQLTSVTQQLAGAKKANSAATKQKAADQAAGKPQSVLDQDDATVQQTGDQVSNYTGTQSKLQGTDGTGGSIADLQGKLNGVKAQAAAVIDGMNQERLSAARLASEDANAFATDREHHAFWMADSKPGKDPVKRCTIYGYDNSNILFVRGHAKDIAKVKEILSEFDRPAPQALVSLYTVQFSGSDPNRIGKVVSDVETELNGLQGNLTLIEDTLRNAISHEVDRQSRVTELIFPNDLQNPDADPLTPVERRSFYYPEEIRNAFGMDLRIPDSNRDAATTFDDLAQGLNEYLAAIESQKKVLDYVKARSPRSIDAARIERGISLTRSGYFAEQALRSFDKLSGQSNSMILSNNAPIKKLQDLGRKLTGYIRDSKITDDEYCKALLELPDSADTSAIPDIGERLDKEKDKLLKDIRVLAVVLKNLAKCKVPAVDPERKWLTESTIPDPSHGTTLGELLFVYSLGSDESRRRILADWSQSLFDAEQRKLGDSTGRGLQALFKGTFKDRSFSAADFDLVTFVTSLETLYGNSAENTYEVDKTPNMFPYFPRTISGSVDVRNELSSGGDLLGIAHHDALTANQKEILSAILTKVRYNVAMKGMQDLDALHQDQKGDIVPATISGPGTKEVAAKIAEFGNWLGDVPNASAKPDEKPVAPKSTGTQDISDRFQPANILQQKQPALESDPGGQMPALEMVFKRKMLENNLVAATPRVAAADSMIKRFITVYQGDMYHFLVGPALDRIRKDASSGGIEFGNMEQEMILATNRYVARVDADAQASLGSTGVQNAENESQQLAMITQSLNRGDQQQKGSKLSTLATIGGAARDMQGKPLALNNLGAGTLIGTLLGGLFDSSEPLGELYSLNGGSEFKITPIFDPSGQAMRFKFDYSANTRLQDPNGTRDPLVPRIERHTVNTEVEVTNGQFQVISSFDLNSKIGKPTVRTGGIPPFNHIDQLKDIPILGYFTRSNRQAAVRQHSLIFANTTMYPTVGAIVNLLVGDSPPAVDSSNINSSPTSK